MTPSDHALDLLDHAVNADRPGLDTRARLRAATMREETLVAEQVGGPTGSWRITRHRYTLPTEATLDLWALELGASAGELVIEVFSDELGPTLRLAR